MQPHFRFQFEVVCPFCSVAESGCIDASFGRSALGVAIVCQKRMPWPHGSKPGEEWSRMLHAHSRAAHLAFESAL